MTLSPETDPTLSVVIVSWNVRHLLLRAIQSIQCAWAEDRRELEIIVVDNGSTDGTVASVRAQYPDVHLIANPHNAGFTEGNNQGIQVSKGKFVLLLNPDTEVKDRALSTLIGHLNEHPEVGLVGPQLRNPDGTVQPSRRRFPTLPVLFLESTWLQGLMPRSILRRYYVQDRSPQSAQKVDWVTGAAMMVRRAVIEEVGGLDEGFFMYSEELDWCRRIRAAGWEIGYVPASNVVHYEGRSSDQVVPARHVYFQSSKVRYTAKYHGQLVAEVLRGWLLAQYGWQLAVEGLKWLVGHRRALRADRVHAYIKVIRSGLRERKPGGGDAATSS